jgi:heme-degrading monooxygenase HmoA
MADVVICYAPENEATLRQLTDAVAREGYDVWHGDSAAPDVSVTDEVAAAKAVIVIWSEAAAASEWVKAEANVARGLKKLVQVSADGRPPPIPFDRAQMISVLTWRGEEDHPAWRSIKAGIEALAGPPPERVVVAAPVETAPPEPPAPVVAPVPPAPAPVPTPPPPPVSDIAPARGPNKGLIVAAVLLVVALLAAGAWYWMTQREGAGFGSAPSLELNMTGAEPAPAEPIADAQPPEEPPAAPEPAETFDRQATLQGVDHAMVRSTPDGIGFDIARIEAGEVFSTYEQPGDWWRVRTRAGRTGYVNMNLIRLRGAPPAEPAPEAVPQPVPQATPARPVPPRPVTPPARMTERRPAPRPPRGPRIRKENSEVMEAFCENAGQGTPQCRAFSRSR